MENDFNTKVEKYHSALLNTVIQLYARQEALINLVLEVRRHQGLGLSEKDIAEDFDIKSKAAFKRLHELMSTQFGELGISDLFGSAKE